MSHEKVLLIRFIIIEWLMLTGLWQPYRAE